MKQQPQELDDILKILDAIYKECKTLSLDCHIPPEHILRHVPPWMRKYYRKVLRRAVNKGYVYEKPHGKGSRSYGLTRKGRDLLLEHYRNA